ncbi:MAG: DUF3300 domain-containing protein [Thiocapsa sp.]|nr:DUF3300 domain-containing protein [Thiocapsa sp.]MCG6896007.1 DUF3300 domain-containing protein [Thiocapsa sp.]
MSNLARRVMTLVLSISLGLAVQARAAEKADAELIPADQLEQLVAPIALYPDALIAQILMASTYPLDVVQANRWLGDREGLEGDDLQKAVDQEPWDDSVKALAFFPSVLEFMSDNLDWTQDLGDAVLAQQGELTDTIQRLRGEADKAGALTSNEVQRVEKAGDTIVIQPAQPEVVYLPTYDPVKAYGQSSPPAKEYYPDAYADATASYDAGYAAGRAAGDSATAYVPSGEVASSSGTDSLVNFGFGALAGGLLTAAIMWDDDDDRNDRLYYGGPGYYGAPSYWGQPNYWNNNGWREPANINLNRTRNIDIDRNVERGDINIKKGIVGNEVKKWEHNPERRGGVRYRNSSTENKFAAKRKERTIDRDEARGRLKGGDRQVKAPDLDQVRREGAKSGRLDDLKDRGGAGRTFADRDQRPSAGDARAKVQAKAPQARAKVQAKAPAAQAKAKAKPKVNTAAATRRPVNTAAKRPPVSQVKRPAKTAARPQAKRPAVSQASKHKASAFKAGKPKAARAASNRGGASRAKAGASRGGGGGRAIRR